MDVTPKLLISTARKIGQGKINDQSLRAAALRFNLDELQLRALLVQDGRGIVLGLGKKVAE